jgi:hypothetical protein
VLGVAEYTFVDDGEVGAVVDVVDDDDAVFV